jgi:hypothetical protein
MRDGSPDARAALSRQGRYQTVKDNLRVKEAGVGDGDAAKRFIICHNPAEAGRERTQRDETIHRLQAELERIQTQRSKAKSANAREVHTRAECALRDHPALGRNLRQTKTGRLLIDRSKIKAEERLDGKFLLSTSDPDLSAEDVALGHKNLLEAERGFRDCPVSRNRERSGRLMVCGGCCKLMPAARCSGRGGAASRSSRAGAHRCRCA